MGVAKKLGMGFHPDTRFADYIDYRTHRPLFGKREAVVLDRKMDCAQQRLGAEVYAIAVRIAMPKKS